MTEIWKDLQGYRETYQVSNLGNVKTKEREGVDGHHIASKELTKRDNSNGYYRVDIRLKNDEHRKSYLVHRLVGLLFIPREEGKDFINHIDGNKHNNCVDNLEWCTKSENQIHAWKMGLVPHETLIRSGENHSVHKLTQEEVNWIRANYKPRDKEFGARALGRKFNVCSATISNIVNYKSWRDNHNINNCR